MLTDNLEENVLALLCHSETHAETVATLVPVELFSTRVYREIAKVSIQHVNRYARPPGVHLYDLLEKQLKKGAEGELIRASLDMMASVYPQMQPDYIAAQLKAFVRQREMIARATKYLALAEKGELDKAEELASLGHNGGPPLDDKITELSSYDPSGMLSFLDQKEEDFYSMGIGELDVRGVRPARKTLTLLIAPPKRGKSWFLTSVGKYALLHGHKVLHVSLENSAELVSKRYVMSLLGMASKAVDDMRIPVFRRNDYGQCVGIEWENLTKIEVISLENKARILRKLQGLRRRPELKIKEFPSGQLTMTMFNRYLDLLDKKDKFIPDIIIMDYPDLMKVSSDNKRHDLSKIFVDCRGVGSERDLAFVAATQGTRSSSDASLVNMSDVAEDFSKVATADMLLTYSRTKAERAAKLARILVAGSRDSEDEFITLISQNYALGQFCLDSVYLSNEVQVLANRMTGDKADKKEKGDKDD